eukprot:m.16700 g.16700  ORF g.16700 m.16700 type:complete len:139 (+) comp5082_c0_seq1:765-1181(+)
MIEKPMSLFVALSCGCRIVESNGGPFAPDKRRGGKARCSLAEGAAENTVLTMLESQRVAFGGVWHGTFRSTDIGSLQPNLLTFHLVKWHAGIGIRLYLQNITYDGQPLEGEASWRTDSDFVHKNSATFTQRYAEPDNN